MFVLAISFFLFRCVQEIGSEASMDMAGRVPFEHNNFMQVFSMHKMNECFFALVEDPSKSGL